MSQHINSTTNIAEGIRINAGQSLCLLVVAVRNIAVARVALHIELITQSVNATTRSLVLITMQPS
jgi:hypothetical protein